jgi:hypothetical protein
MQAENGDLAQAATALRNVESFWPPEVPHEGRLASVVAASRDSTVREIITRMRALSGEDLGNDPKVWIGKYCRDAEVGTNQSHGTTPPPTLDSVTNTTPAADVTSSSH